MTIGIGYLSFTISTFVKIALKGEVIGMNDKLIHDILTKVMNLNKQGHNFSFEYDKSNIIAVKKFEKITGKGDQLKRHWLIYNDDEKSLSNLSEHLTKTMSL